MSRIIRVLHVVATGRPGGVESFVQDLVRHIDRNRFDVSVCIMADDGPVGERLRAADCHVFTLQCRGRLTRASAVAFLRQTAGRFDILHLNGGGAALRLLARIAGCRRTITHVHGFPDEWLVPMRRGQRSMTRTFARTYGWGTHRIVVPSRHMEETLLANCPSLGARITRIQHGVDLQRFQPFDVADGATIGFIGRLAPEKGISQFLAVSAAVRQVTPHARFIVVGDGVLRRDVETAAARHEATGVMWLGERHDIENVLPSVDVVAVPSQVEAFGLVCLEAMACARPVVAFDVGGIPEVVVHGETGLLVRAGDTNAFALGLLELLRQPDERRRLGKAGRARVESFFDVKRTIHAFESLYDATI